MRNESSGRFVGAAMVCLLLACSAIGHTAHLQGRVELVQGLNLVGVPVDPILVPDLRALLRYLGPPEAISRVTRLDPYTGLFEDCGYAEDGRPEGAGCGAPVAPGEGWVVQANEATAVDYDLETPCPKSSLI